jgi:hypothetical protein
VILLKSLAEEQGSFLLVVHPALGRVYRQSLRVLITDIDKQK